MTHYLPIHGTWGESDDWVEPTSPFAAFMRANDCLAIGDEPFRWSGDVGGALRFAWSRRHSDWRAGAHAIHYYLRAEASYVPIAQRNVIAHSHGGQIVLMACGVHALKINCLFTVGTPVRKDMADIIRQARPNIMFWVHITDASLWRNKFQVLGQMFDGEFGLPWTFPLADLNYKVRGIGHSKVLMDPAEFHRWVDNGWLEILKGRR